MLLNPPQAGRKGIRVISSQKLQLHFSDYLRGGCPEVDPHVAPLIYIDRGNVLRRSLSGSEKGRRGQGKGLDDN